MKVKSVKRLNPTFSKCGTVVKVELETNNIVYPSAFVLDSKAVPKAPPAPGLLITMTGCPKTSPILGAKLRAMISAIPPGAQGTIKSRVY